MTPNLGRFKKKAGPLLRRGAHVACKPSFSFGERSVIDIGDSCHLQKAGDENALAASG